MALGIVRTGLLAASGLLVLATVGQAGAAAIQSQTAKAHRVSQKGSDRSLSVLYDQTSNPSGLGTFSQNFGSGDTNSSAAADDFVVPDGATWVVKELDISGVYFNGSGPANSESVTFFKDKHGKVGKVVAELDALHGADDFGSFAITLGDKGVKLKSGHYWVSAVVNMSFAAGGEWAWDNQTAGTTEGDPAMWENPGGTICKTWTPQNECGFGGGGSLGDEMFILKGKAK